MLILLFNNNIAQIFNVDGDNSISPAQAGVVISGAGLFPGVSARIRVSNYRLDMESYSAGVSPTFNTPDITSFFSSGMPLGTVSFDILRSV